MEPKRKKISGNVGMTAMWYKEVFGLIEPDPFTEDPNSQAEKDERKSKLMYEKYPDLHLGSANPRCDYRVPGYDGGTVIMSAYGASEPIWEEDSACFWRSRESRPWSWVQTVEDVKKIKIPVWDDVKLVQKTKERYDEIQKRVKQHPERGIDFSVYEYRWTNPDTDGQLYKLFAFTSYIDLGLPMFGADEFFMKLALEPDFSHALMEKVFEISISYGEYIMKLYDYKLEGLCAFGGDYSCMLSPELYQKYAISYDSMMAERYGKLPSNLHSCGPSKHLYDVWGGYPCKDQIVVMQTRGIVGELGRLRKALPETYLQITIHQPQFDFENERPENIKNLVRQYAKEADYRDLELYVLISKPGEQTDRNIRAFYEAIEEVNNIMEVT